MEQNYVTVSITLCIRTGGGTPVLVVGDVERLFLRGVDGAQSWHGARVNQRLVVHVTAARARSTALRALLPLQQLRNSQPHIAADRRYSRTDTQPSHNI